jgi:hypothetical protein
LARTRQLNIRLTDGEMACLEAVRGPGRSQADLVADLVLQECERRWHSCGTCMDEDGAAPYADALWILDHEVGKEWTGRRPTLPRRAAPGPLRPQS